MAIGTICSEFPYYSFETLAGYTRNKIQVLYLEALRQRASKGLFLAQLINRVHMEKKEQDNLMTTVDRYLNPHVDKEQVYADNWDSLRSRRRA